MIGFIILLTISIMMFILVMVGPHDTIKLYRWMTMSSEINSEFLNELRFNSNSVRERKIQKEVNKMCKRVPKMMRIEAANGSRRCDIRVNCDREIKTEVLDRVFNWAKKKGLNPGEQFKEGFSVNWN